MGDGGKSVFVASATGRIDTYVLGHRTMTLLRSVSYGGGPFAGLALTIRRSLHLSGQLEAVMTGPT